MKRHPSLAALSRDHHHVLVLAKALRSDAPERLRNTLPEDPAALVAALRARFATELEPHFRIEEKELVAPSRGHGEPLAAHAERVEGEHHTLREMVAALEVGVGLGEQLDAFAQLLEAHVRFEERVWFPSLQEALGSEALEAMAARLTPPHEHELAALRERAKELTCLYRVNEVLLDRVQAPHVVFRRVCEAIPPGWQHPETTHARIVYLGRHYPSPGFEEGAATIRAEIHTWDSRVGFVEVVDTALLTPDAFLAEERILLDTIAARLGDYLEWKQQELLDEPIGAATEQWRWRQSFAERLAASLDGKRFGVTAVYLYGSTERGDAAPTSDIDLAIVFTGTEAQRSELTLWLEGWGLCLAEVARRQTGYFSPDGLLDIRWLDEAPKPSERHLMRELPLASE